MNFLTKPGKGEAVYLCPQRKGPTGGWVAAFTRTEVRRGGRKGAHPGFLQSLPALGLEAEEVPVIEKPDKGTRSQEYRGVINPAANSPIPLFPD